MSYFDKTTKPKTLIIVVGAQSTGSKLCTYICGMSQDIKLSGGFNVSSSDGFWESYDPKLLDFGDYQKMVTHRSFPHGAFENRKGYDLQKAISSALSIAEVVVIITTRDRSISIESAVTNHAMLYDDAKMWHDAAYTQIFKAVNQTKVRHFVWSYESCMSLGDQYTKLLYQFLRVEPAPSDRLFSDGNCKYLKTTTVGVGRLFGEVHLGHVFERMLLYTLVCGIGAKSAIEIGTLRGHSAVWIAQGLLDNSGQKLYCIDPFGGVGAIRNDYEFAVSLFDKLKLTNIEIIREKSLVALPWFTNESIDFILIDGDHSEPSVRHDFQEAIRIVSDGGIIVLHDVCSHLSVHNFAMEIIDDYPSLYLPCGYGMLVIQKGRQTKTDLASLEHLVSMCQLDPYDNS